jgi:3-deoxy-D-manno-octulosonic-acid transferase
MPGRMQTAALCFYKVAWKAAIPFLSRNKRLAEGLAQRKLERKLPKADIWIQAASAGESYLAQSILKSVKLRKPVHVLVTSNTRQGMDIIAGTITDMASEKENIRISSAYFPFDCPGIMKQAVKEVSPDVMVLLESDLWPGLLSALKRAGSKVLVINGRMAEKSLRHYQIWPSFWKHLAPDRIFAVSHEDALRFGALFGKNRVSIMSNIKFDRISATETYPEIVESVERILPSDIPFLVLASVRKEEEPLILKMIQKILTDHPKTVIGLFPRHMHRLSHWQKALSKISIPWRYRSETMEPVEPGTVLVWDSFGELASSYQLAKAAFVGGSLAPLGGQNFLEPLLHGVIPVIGPSWFNFYWVGRQIIDLKLVHIADDWEKAANLLIHALKIPFSRENIRNAAIAYIKQHQGGTARACKIIAQYLPAISADQAKFLNKSR